MRITSHRHYTFKNLCLFSYSDGGKNLCKALRSGQTCSERLRHFLAGVILLTPGLNCVAQTYFIKNQRKRHLKIHILQQKKKAKKKAPIPKQVSAKLPSIKAPSIVVLPKVTKPPILNNSPEIEELLSAERFQLKPHKNTEILEILKHDPLAAWKKYRDCQGITNYPGQISINKYIWIPPIELLDVLAFDVWGDSGKLIHYWPPEFMRDCAIAHPQFAMKCINTDLLWECFKGCNDEVMDICKINSSAAWELIQIRTDVNYRPENLLNIFQSAHAAIMSETQLSSDQAEKLSTFLSNCTLLIKQQYFDLLAEIVASHPSLSLQNITQQWTAQGVY